MYLFVALNFVMEMKDSLNIKEKKAYTRTQHKHTHKSLAKKIEKNLIILQDLNYDSNYCSIPYFYCRLCGQPRLCE